MNEATSHKHQIIWKRYGFKNLLGWLVVYLMVGPFLESLPYAHTAVSVFLSVVLFSAICAVNKDSKLLPVAIVLLVLTLSLMWLAKLGVFRASSMIYPGLLALYLGILAYSFLRYIHESKRVDANVIYAALCTYLTLGLLWGALFTLLEGIVPNSFIGGPLDTATATHDKVHFLNYFSFVTLSTLGYGDITPQTQGATALCQAEAVLGQFFTVVLVARLVGIQVAQEATPNN